ncbi:MAG: hypothetical protein E7182_06405 [Erysipelotrichaceae bacterium]|nr:hypothetical protein [Erysipelotrichaceae bacterium]
MFLSKLFKRKSTKLLTLFGALAMALGVGAAASYVASEQQNEVVETGAETEADNDRYLRFVLPNGDWWTDSNVNTAVWGDGTYMANNWQTKEDDFANYSQNKYNSVSVNGTTTMQYFQVYVGNSGTLTNLNGKDLYIKRLKGSDPNVYYNQATLSNYNSATGNTIKISGGSATNDGFYYKIRLKIQTSVGGSWTTHACYLYKKGNNCALPTLEKEQCPANYKFDGWCTDSACTSATIASLSPTADTVLYAKYSIGMYLIGDGVGTATGWTVNSAVLGNLATNNTDVAYWEGISIAINAEFRLVQIADGANCNYYTTSGAGEAYNAESGDIRGGGGANFKCYTAGVYDIYYSKDGDLYFINETSKATLGYLYIPYTASGNTTLNIVTYKVPNGSSGGDECISGTLLWTSVPSAVSYSSIHFSGHYGSTKTGLARIPIYDLRGLNSNAALSFKISLDGGTSWSSVVNLPGTTDTPHVYWEYGWGGVSGTMGVAARALFEIGSAIETAEDETLCSIDQTLATTLVGYYDAVTSELDSYSDFRASSIYTYVEDNTYQDGEVEDTDKTEVAIADIYTELYSRSTTGKWTVKFVPGNYSSDSSPLTTTLWIVLASGLAGLAAIGTAYFVSKKKRHQA